jgi:phosphate transport system permease protein
MSGALATPVRNLGVAARLGRQRKVGDFVARILAWIATAAALAMLAWILVTLVWLGARGFTVTTLTTVMKAPGSSGGLANAIVGSLVQTALGTAVGTPIGLMVGTYLAEYAGRSLLGNAVRFVSDILLSAPSILIGLFIYTIMVAPFGGFSGIAGAAALAVIVIPIVVRTTEDMLNLIPVSLREAAIALGAPRWRTTVFICYRAAREGLLTGVLLAVARIAGETAPLLFTSLGNNDYSGVTSAMASLPVMIYQYAQSAFDDWVQLAWTGALLITLGVLAINIAARLVLRRR